jgi:hypothetical protein
MIAPPPGAAEFKGLEVPSRGSASPKLEIEAQPKVDRHHMQQAISLEWCGTGGKPDKQTTMGGDWVYAIGDARRSACELE